jgi:hypothetical protein
VSAGKDTMDSRPIGPGSQMPAPPPVVPQQSQSSGCLKSCLFAGIGLVAVAIVAVIILGVTVGGKFKDWEAMFLEQSKPTYMGYLSKDVTDQERQDFEKVYDEMTKSIKEQGILKTAEQHESGLLLFNQIIADQQITREESKQFVDGWNKPGTKPKSP